MRVAFSTIPWLVPGAVLSVVAGFLAAPTVARALATRRAVAILLVFSVGLVLSATLTPLRDALAVGFIPEARPCDLSRMTVAPMAELLRINDTSLNVVLFVPLGIAIGLLPMSIARFAVQLAAIVLPIGIETAQLLLPILHRGCQSADVVDNLMGLTIGLVIGTTTLAILTVARPLTPLRPR